MLFSSPGALPTDHALSVPRMAATRPTEEAVEAAALAMLPGLRRRYPGAIFILEDARHDHLAPHDGRPVLDAPPSGPDVDPVDQDT